MTSTTIMGQRAVPTNRRAILFAIFIAFGQFPRLTLMQLFLTSSLLQEVSLTDNSVYYMTVSDCSPALIPISTDTSSSEPVSTSSGFLFGYDVGVIAVSTLLL